MRDDTLEVWLDCDLGPPCRIGALAHDRGQVRFRYAADWVTDARAFAIDPDLSLDEQPFFPKPELGNFGIFLDSNCSDVWPSTSRWEIVTTIFAITGSSSSAAEGAWRRLSTSTPISTKPSMC